jgi:hypothetical protein
MDVVNLLRRIGKLTFFSTRNAFFDRLDNWTFDESYLPLTIAANNFLEIIKSSVLEEINTLTKNL